MSAELHKSVFRAKAEFEALTNRKPTKLLLGKRELRWLVRLAESTCMTVSTKPGPSRTEYMGLAVYEMDDAEFIAVT